MLTTYDGTVFGLLSVILLGLGVAAWRLFAWLTDKDGPINRLVDSHIEFVESTRGIDKQLLKCTEEQVSLHASHFAESNRTAVQLDALLEAGQHACDALELVCQKAGINGEVSRSIQRVRTQLQEALSDV